MARHRFVAALGGVATAALAVRACHLWSILHSPLGATLVEDAAYYQAEALRIAGLSAGPAPSGPSFMNLGLPYAIAGVYALTGPSVAAFLSVQAVLGSLAVVLVALAGASLSGDRRVGILAGALYALYAPAIFYDGLLLTPSLVNVALAIALALLAMSDAGRASLRLVLAGLAVGGAIVLRANILLAVPAIAIVIYLRSRRLRPVAVFAAAALALPLAIAGWNGIAHGEWAPVSSNGGMNFWVGNGLGATGVYASAPFLREVNPAAEERAFLEEARHRTGKGALTTSGASRYWLGQGLHDILASPGRWLRLEGRKLVLFWNHFEVNTNVGFGFVRSFSPLLSLLPFGYGVVVILGAPGLAILAVRRPPDAALPLAIAAAALATVLLFFDSGEYRHPASLAFAIGMAVLVETVRERTRMASREKVAAILTAVVVTPMALWSFKPLEAGCDPRYDFANVAREIATPHPGTPPPGQAEFTRARDLLDRAPNAALDPVILETRAAIGTVAAAQGNDRAWAAGALHDLAALAAQDLAPGRGIYSDAFLRRAPIDMRRNLVHLASLSVVAGDPVLSREAELLGADGWRRVETLLRAGDVDGAMAFIDEALRHAPHDVDLMAEKGRVFLHRGNEREGLAWLERSCAGWPETPRCAIYAAIWYATRGRPAEARAFAEEAVRRDPASPEARAVLAKLSR